MKNFVSSNKVHTLTAPATVVSGTAYKVGLFIVVAQADAVSGQPFACVSKGTFEYAKTSAQAWTEGALLYWDDSAKVFTTTSSGNTLCAKAGAVAANPSTTGIVILDN